MNQDFARKKRSRGAVKQSGKTAQKKQAPPQRSSAWFFSGVLCGVFLSFLVWLASQQPDPTAAESRKPTANEADKSEQTRKPEFSFYTLLPEQNVTVKVDPADVARARRVEGMDQFLLQAGSFRQKEDAERRRAELILLNLNPDVQESTGNNGRWFRVYIGPFESRSKLNKARSITAQQGIETLLLKRPAG